MKKLVCVINTYAHSRCFESIPKSNRFDITMVALKPQKNAGIFPNNYCNFDNKKLVYYVDHREIPGIVNKINPDVYATSNVNDLKDKIKCGIKVLVMHGMVGKTINKIYPNQAKEKDNLWNGFDLYCGEMNFLEDWIRGGNKISSPIILNALPQLDLVYRYNNNAKYRNVLGKVIKKKYKEIIMFIGFCCKDRIDFIHNNKDYFDAFNYLVRWAEKNNVLIVTKARQPLSKINYFLKTNKKRWGCWTQSYIGLLEKLYKSPNVHVMDGKNHLYWYFFSDRMVINGTSTLEVEAMLADKPMIIYKSIKDINSDYFNMTKFGITKVARDKGEFISLLNSHFSVDQAAKTLYIKKMGLKFDGMHGARVINEIERRFG